MIDHRHAIELAATAVDFELDPAERQLLDEHLEACAPCRADARVLQDDVVDLAALPVIAPPAWVRRAVGRRRGPRRTVLLIGAAAVLVGTVGVAFTVGEALRDRAVVNVPVSPAPRSTIVVETPLPSVTASPSPVIPLGPPPLATPASFPVKNGSALMAPGPDGGAWVLVVDPAIQAGAASTSVVALLDRAGAPRPGWPIAFHGWDCGGVATPHQLMVATDGSIRLDCAADTVGEAPQRHVALALSADGSALPGWPVELPQSGGGASVIVGDELRVLASDIASTEGSVVSAQPASWWLISVSADGTVQVGQSFAVTDAAGSFDVRFAADGVAYRISLLAPPGAAVPVTSVIDAIDLGGQRAGWPVTVEGAASHPVVAPDGRLFVVVDRYGNRYGTSPDSSAQTMAIDPNGGAATAMSDQMPISPLQDGTGAGSVVLPPLTAADGTMFVLGSDATGQRVFRVDPAAAAKGVPLARLRMPLQHMGVCSPQDTGCGVYRSLPVVGPDGTLFVPESVVGEGGGLSDGAGGSLVAIAPDGTSRTGWPIQLPDPMAGFWSLAASADGAVDALAEVPTDGGASWTLMILGPDGRTRASTAIITP